MKQCERCLKHVDIDGAHTCKPTKYARTLEFMLNEKGWQPIETAPRSGVEIIAYGIRRGDYGVTSDEHTWTGIRWASESYSNGLRVDAHWVESRCTPRHSCGFKPTHWITLPAPPKDNP